MSVAAGMLNSLIALAEPVRITDEFGGERTEWSIKGHVWAEIRPQSAKEAMQSQQIQSSSVYTVTMRRPPFTFDERWRIEYLGDVYNIRGILVSSQRDKWTITAEIASYEQDGI